MDFYFLNRRELKKNEISGNAWQHLQEFIKASLGNNRTKAVEQVVDYKELKKLERDCPDIIPDDNLVSNYVSPPSDVKIRCELPELPQIENKKKKEKPRKVKCKECGAEIIVYAYRKKAKYCSAECRIKAFAVNMKGKKRCKK